MSQAFDNTLAVLTGPSTALPPTGTLALTVRPHNDQSVPNNLYIYATLSRGGTDFVYLRNYTGVDLGAIFHNAGTDHTLTGGWNSGANKFNGVSTSFPWAPNSWHYIFLQWQDNGNGTTTFTALCDGHSTGSVTLTLASLAGWTVYVGNLFGGNPYGSHSDVAQVALDNTYWSPTQIGWYMQGVSPSVVSSTLIDWWPLVGAALTNSGTDGTALIALGSTTVGPDPTINAPRIYSATIAPSGQTLVVAADNSNGNAIGLSLTLSHPVKVVVNGGSPITLDNSRYIYEGWYAAWLLPQGTVVRSSDTVTATIPAGTWMTSIGPNVAYSGAVDVSLAPATGSNSITGSYLDPVTLEPNLMKIGYNAPYVGPGSVPIFANILRQSPSTLGNAMGNGYGANGNTTAHWTTDNQSGYPTFSAWTTAFSTSPTPATARTRSHGTSPTSATCS